MHSNSNLSTKSRSLLLLTAVAVLAILAITAQASAQHFITIDAPGAQGTLPWGINLMGAVDGTYIDANNMYHGFLRAPNGKIVTFEVPEAGTSAGQGTVPQGINVWGWITGQYYAGNLSHGFLRAPDGRATTFDVPGAGAAGILGSGGVGSWASEYQGTYPESINDLGEIVRYYVDTNWVWHGFVRDADGKITPFDAPGAGTGPYQGTGVNYTCPSLNNAGVLAGYNIDGNNLNHGYLRPRDGHITTFAYE